MNVKTTGNRPTAALTLGTVLMVVAADVATPAAARGPAGACDREINSYIERATTLYEKKRRLVRESDLIEEAKKAYYRKFEELKENAIAKAETARQQCHDDVKPLQDIMDGLVAYYTSGLSMVLPDRMTHVDVSEILNGKPLGGPNALVPKFRRQLGDALGIDFENGNGEVEKLVRDPLQYILKFGDI